MRNLSPSAHPALPSLVRGLTWLVGWENSEEILSAWDGIKRQEHRGTNPLSMWDCEMHWMKTWSYNLKGIKEVNCLHRYQFSITTSYLQMSSLSSISLSAPQEPPLLAAPLGFPATPVGCCFKAADWAHLLWGLLEGHVMPSLISSVAFFPLPLTHLRPTPHRSSQDMVWWRNQRVGNDDVDLCSHLEKSRCFWPHLTGLWRCSTRGNEHRELAYLVLTELVSTIATVLPKWIDQWYQGILLPCSANTPESLALTLPPKWSKTFQQATRFARFETAIFISSQQVMP